MNMVHWLEECLKNPIRKPLPILSSPGIQLMGITVRELVLQGELQAKCMKAIADRYPTLASVSIMDLSVEAEAFGANATYYDREIPSITRRLIETGTDAENLQIPPVGAGRTGECVKAIDEPDMVHLVLDKVTRFLIEYILALKNSKANGIVMAEPAAGLLSPDWNREFSAQYVKRIVAAAQDKNFLVVYHNCGNVVPMLDVINQVPTDCLVMGNIDPATRITHGTPESIHAATHFLNEQMRGHSNFILSSGCDIPPQAPMQNIDAFFQAAALSV